MVVKEIELLLVLSSTFLLSETFQVNVSTRIDEYDAKKVNVDRRTMGASFEWRPADNFLLRGSWSESFKAPDLPYSFVGERRFFAVETDYLSMLCIW